MNTQTLWHAMEQNTVNAILADSTVKYGDRPLLDFQGEIHSYGEIDQLSTRLAAGLRNLGVAQGETLVSMLDNNLDAVLTWFALGKLGAINVPTNTAFKGEFLRHQISDAGATIVIAEEDYAERVVAIADQLPQLKTLVCRGRPPQAADVHFDIVPLDDLRIDAEGFEPVAVKPSDLSMLIYTSGTTGPSKGCMISHNFVCNLARQSRYCNQYTERDVAWTALPLFHLNAVSLILGIASVGAKVAIYPRFSLSGFWPDIERSGATLANLLGSMAPLIANMPDTEEAKRCFGQLHTVVTAPFPDDLKEKWRTRYGAKTMGAPGYGLTEACMVVYGRVGDPKAPPGSSGHRQDDYEVMIVDDNDNEVPPGTAGEIVVRPRSQDVMFQGYWNRPADTLKVMRNMWFHTGDIGKFDEQGYFYFLDRKKDYLRRRGENISSFEMEKTFGAHPAISDVAVHAVFSPMGEDDVKVTAVLRDGAVLSEEELCRWCLDKVPYFAVPRYIEFRKDLPRNPTGKVLKYQLRDEGCTAATWDREKADFEMKKR